MYFNSHFAIIFAVAGWFDEPIAVVFKK